MADFFSKKTFYLIFPSLLLGFIVGLIIGDIPFVELTYVKKVQIKSIFSIVITALAILSAPFIAAFITKKLIEDNRSLKNSLISDLNDFNEMIQEIHKRFGEIYFNGNITSDEKNELIYMFEKSDSRIYPLSILIQDNCAEATKILMQDLEDKYILYWQVVTGEVVTGEKITNISEQTRNMEHRRISSMGVSAASLKSGILQI